MVFEDTAEMEARLATETTFNVIDPVAVGSSDPGYCLAAHFVSNLVPVGHIKSTKIDDQEFLEYFSASEKWLKCN